MVTFKSFPWVHEFTDRHGKIRRYFRRPRFKRVALQGEPGSVEFALSYDRALNGAAKIEIGEKRTVPGTVSAAIVGYYASSIYKNLAPETQRTWRNQLERFRATKGGKRISALEHRHIDLILAERADRPASARNFMKALRSLIKYCLASKLVTDDPTAGISLPQLKSEGYRTWSEEDIAQFETRHPIGTRAHLALSLLLYTGQRRGDVVKMGRQHVRDGWLHVRQGKTGTPLTIPLHARLVESIEAATVGQLTFLTTAQGKPFSPAGFTNLFRDYCDEAGLPKGTSAHGLRKAACRRLAEAGCSANEIAAISGHATLSEVSRYTRAADQKRMAEAAMGKIAPLKKRGT